MTDVDREEDRIFDRLVALSTVSSRDLVPCLVTYRVVNLLLIFLVLARSIILRRISHCVCEEVGLAIVGGERCA